MGVRLQCSMRAMPMHDRHGGVTVTALVRQPIAIGPTDQSPMCMARLELRLGLGLVRFYLSQSGLSDYWAVGLMDHERAMTISQTPCPTPPESGGQLNGRQSHMFPIRESKGGGL